MPAPDAIRQIMHAARHAHRVVSGAVYTLIARARLWAAGARVGAGFRATGWIHLRIHPTARLELGPRVRINSGAQVNLVGSGQRTGIHLGRGATVRIGADVGMSGVVLVARERIEIGQGTLLGGGCLVVDSNLHALPLPADARAHDARTPASAPVVIGARVFIGAHAIILRGSTIGDGAIIGAGAVVAGAIPPGAIAQGIPARVRVSSAAHAS